MLQVTCECGWTCNAERDALVRHVRDHSVRHHGRAVPTDDEILAVAVPTPAAGTDGSDGDERAGGGARH